MSIALKRIRESHFWPRLEKATSLCDEAFMELIEKRSFDAVKDFCAASRISVSEILFEYLICVRTESDLEKLRKVIARHTNVLSTGARQIVEIAGSFGDAETQAKSYSDNIARRIRLLDCLTNDKISQLLEVLVANGANFFPSEAPETKDDSLATQVKTRIALLVALAISELRSEKGPADFEAVTSHLGLVTQIINALDALEPYVPKEFSGLRSEISLKVAGPLNEWFESELTEGSLEKLNSAERELVKISQKIQFPVIGFNNFSLPDTASEDIHISQPATPFLRPSSGLVGKFRVAIESALNLSYEPDKKIFDAILQDEKTLASVLTGSLSDTFFLLARDASLSSDSRVCIAEGERFTSEFIQELTSFDGLQLDLYTGHEFLSQLLIEVREQVGQVGIEAHWGRVKCVGSQLTLYPADKKAFFSEEANFDKYAAQ